MEEALHPEAWYMGSTWCVCVVRSTLFHCLFSTYIHTYICIYVRGVLFWIHFQCTILRIVCGTGDSAALQASTYLQSIITLLHPLPFLPVATITLSSLSAPCNPFLLSLPLTFTSCPSLYPPLIHDTTSRSGTWMELFAVSPDPICHWPSLHLPCWCVPHCWPCHSYDHL